MPIEGVWAVTRKMLIAAMAFALVVAGCGDDDDAATTTTAAGGTTATTSDSDTATTQAGDGDTTTTGVTAAPSTTADDGEPTASDLGDLAATFAMTPARLTYLFGEPGDQDEVILSQDPTQDPPVSAIIAQGDFKIIYTGTANIVCSPDCFEVPSLGDAAITDNLVGGLMGPIAGALLTADGLSSVPGIGVDEEQVTIAGRSGICFTFTPPAGSGADSGRVCIDDELGFMLRVDDREAGTDTFVPLMELTEFGDPLPEDFEPLGPVQSTP